MRLTSISKTAIRGEGMLNNRRRRPTHPGAILREDILPAAGLTQVELATMLKVSRRTISEIIHERRPVTTDVAHRLARVLNTTPEVWLRMQQAVDLWDAFAVHQQVYRRLKPLAHKPVAA